MLLAADDPGIVELGGAEEEVAVTLRGPHRPDIDEDLGVAL